MPNYLYCKASIKPVLTTLDASLLTQPPTIEFPLNPWAVLFGKSIFKGQY